MDIDPALINAGPFFASWGTVTAALAIIAGLHVARSWAAADRYPGSVTMLVCLALIGGLTTGRVAVLSEQPQILGRGFAAAFAFSLGGVSVPAAAFGAVAAVVPLLIVRRRLIAPVLAAGAIALLVGETVAGVGLLVTGEPAGPLAAFGLVYMRPDSAVPATLLGRPILPLALGSLLWSGIAAGLLWATRPDTTPFDRWRFGVFAFGLGHFLVGFARLDPIWLLGLRQDQALGLLWAVIGGAGLIFRASRPAPPSAATGPRQTS